MHLVPSVESRRVDRLVGSPGVGLESFTGEVVLPAVLCYRKFWTTSCLKEGFSKVKSVFFVFFPIYSYIQMLVNLL